MAVQHWLKIPARIIKNLESDRIPFQNYVITFFSAVFLRHFIEAYSQLENIFNSESSVVRMNIIHFQLSFATVGLLLTVFIHFTQRVSIEKIMRVMIPCMMIILLPPLIDLITSFGAGVELRYYMPALPGEAEPNMLYTYLTIGGKAVGVSYGLRAEIVLIMIASLIYFLVKGSRIVSALAQMWVSYTIIFLWGAAPYMIRFVQELFGYPYKISVAIIISYYLVFIFILFLLVSYLADKQKFRSFIKLNYLLVFLYYELTFFLGMAFALSVQFSSVSYVLNANPSIIVDGIVAMMAVAFFSLFSAMMSRSNEIDVVGGKQVEHINCSGSGYFYGGSALLCGGLALFFASNVGAKIFLIVGVLISISFIYNTLPLALCRVPVISKLMLALSSFALLLLGFVVVQNGVLLFPRGAMWIYFIGVTLAASFLDVDKNRRVKFDSSFLRDLMGTRLLRILSGVATCGVFISFYFVLDNLYMLLLLAIMGLAAMYSIIYNRNSFRCVLFLANIGLLSMIFYLLFLPK